MDREENHIAIENAGLVLSGVFLPSLYRALDLLDASGNEYRDDKAASRAVHLSQFLVDNSLSTPEPKLVLNKTLCGVPIENPIEPEIEITDRERQLCLQLLDSMIDNWSVLGDTSREGLQEAFLRRDGLLTEHRDRWELRVERKPIDVLVDQMPWSIGVVVHPWMSKPLHVDW